MEMTPRFCWMVVGVQLLVCGLFWFDLGKIWVPCLLSELSLVGWGDGERFSSKEATFFESESLLLGEVAGRVSLALCCSMQVGIWSP